MPLGKEGGSDRGRERSREGEIEGGRDLGREGLMEGGREGGRERLHACIIIMAANILEVTPQTCRLLCSSHEECVNPQSLRSLQIN